MVNIYDYPRNDLKEKFEKVGYNNKEYSPAYGRVQIYTHPIGNNKKLYLLQDTSNLVVYRGRSWMAQKVANTSMSGCSGWSDLFLSWFAIGTGGTFSGNPLVPSAPSLTDVALSDHGVIESGVRYITFDGKEYHKFDNGYPTFVDDDEVSSTGLAALTDKKLVLKIVTTLTTDEANDDGGVYDPSATQNISEAGLFFSDSNSVSTLPTIMQLFSRVTFATIPKNDEMQLIFKWYIYF